MEIVQIIHIVAEIVLIIFIVIFLYYQIRKQDSLIDSINKKLEENSALTKKQDSVIGKIVEIITLKVPSQPIETTNKQSQPFEELQFKPPIELQYNPHPVEPRLEPRLEPRVQEIHLTPNIEINQKLERIEEGEEDEDGFENIDAEIEEELKDLEN
jgi:hypothetical protein